MLSTCESGSNLWGKCAVVVVVFSCFSGLISGIDCLRSASGGCLQHLADFFELVSIQLIDYVQNAAFVLLRGVFLATGAHSSSANTRVVDRGGAVTAGVVSNGILLMLWVLAKLELATLVLGEDTASLRARALRVGCGVKIGGANDLEEGPLFREGCQVLSRHQRMRSLHLLACAFSFDFFIEALVLGWDILNGAPTASLEHLLIRSHLFLLVHATCD